MKKINKHDIFLMNLRKSPLLPPKALIELSNCTFLYRAYIPNSIKVALGIGQLGIGKLLFAVTQAKHCFVFHMPKCPMSNCQ